MASSLQPLSRPRALGWLLVALLLTFGASAIGGYVTSMGLPQWYPQLVKPSWTPPDWVFAPVWLALYAAMAVAYWLALLEAHSSQRRTLGIHLWFVLQLVVNVLWSVLFFGLHQPILALVDINVLAICIAITAVVFRRYSPLAALLLLPYLFWVSFAACLNGAIVGLNR